jgi:hypothetical protein
VRLVMLGGKLVLATPIDSNSGEPQTPVSAISRNDADREWEDDSAADYRARVCGTDRQL